MTEIFIWTVSRSSQCCYFYIYFLLESKKKPMVLNSMLIDLQRCALQNGTNISTYKIGNSNEKY